LRRGEAAARELGAQVITADALAKQPYDLGQINPPRQIHCGFLAVLAEIEAASKRGWRVPQPPSAIRLLFDKRQTSQRWSSIGLPVPEALGAAKTPDELRQLMRDAGWGSVYVKMASSSSASCLAIFNSSEHGEQAITTVEDTGRARYNTRKLQILSSKRSIDRLLTFLLNEGSQIERAIPKAQIDGRSFDLRVLTIDGVAAFVVVRTSPHPITNLHLGGQRGSVEELRKLVPAKAWEAAMASCVAAQRDSGAFHVGVDVMLEPGFEAHRLIEGNAFGDLLPNLERDGLDVYGWQIKRLLDE
jgi:glutathione synthase/RimK-type ligase-like ATP-grasp enzyme